VNQVTAAAFAEAAVVTYRATRSGKAAKGATGLQVAGTPTQSPYKMPLPSEYTSVVIVYSVLHLIEPALPRPAGLIAWGLVVATTLNLWKPSSASLTGMSKGSS
jgi:hypothetical protein